MPAAQVQAELRWAFRRWGLPAAVRVDHGFPWGSAHDWPPALALWWVGLGLDVWWIPKCSPQHNGVVERSQGISQQWVEPQTCATPEALQERLNQMDQLQRERYPSVAGQSRWAAYPGLRHSGRRYSKAWERKHWDLQRVVRHLAGYVVERRVTRNGKIGLYDWVYHIGVKYQNELVRVQFDPEDSAWVVTDKKDQQLRRFPAREVSRKRIVGLQMSQRRQ